MEESKFKIEPHAKFPNVYDPFEEKIKPSYGLAIGQSITSEWFYNLAGGSCRFYTNQNDFLNRRTYANGEVNMTKYHPHLGTNGDVSLLSLSLKSFVPVPKLVDLVVNGMCDRNYTIEANAIDPISQKNKLSYRQNIQDERDSKEITELSKQTYGIDIGTMPVEKLPETDDELALHMEMEYKPSCELSAQLAIKMVMEENLYDMTTERQVTRDLVVDGLGVVENRFHPAKGISVERVDPAQMVYSRTSDPFFRDCFYKGRVKRVLITDLYLEFPELRNPENEDIVKRLDEQNSWWNQYHNLGNDLKGYTHVLYFTYRTTREDFYKVKNKKSTGEIKASVAKSNFDPTVETNKKDKFKRVSKVEEVLMEGVLVLGTDILLKWDVLKSMARPNSNQQKVCEQYNMVAPNFQDGRIYSLVSRMMPIADNLNILELKGQQIIQGITPDGIAIDLDATSGIELGNGQKYGHQEALNMYLQKGSYYYRSSTLGGDFNNAQKPFQEIKTGDSIGKLQALRGETDYYLTQLTDVIGLNKATDATTPDRDSLVGIQKLAALNSNLATRHILSGRGFVTLETSKSILYRFQDVLKYYPSIKEDYIRKVGATAIEDIEAISNLHLSDFGLNLHLEQDDEERAILDQDLSKEMENKTITIADKYRIKNIKIHKQAVAYMTVLIDKASKKQAEIEANKFRVQSDENIRAAQEAEKAKQVTIQMDSAAKLEQITLQGTNDLNKEKERGYQEIEKEKEKGKQNKELQYIINAGAVEKLETIEENKKENLVKQASLTSEIKAESKKDNPQPIDFEAREIEKDLNFKKTNKC